MITPSVSHKYSGPERPLWLLIVATDVKSSGYRVMVTQSSSMLHYSLSYIIFLTLSVLKSQVIGKAPSIR
jgi:hypothetical protein